MKLDKNTISQVEVIIETMRSQYVNAYVDKFMGSKNNFKQIQEQVNDVLDNIATKEEVVLVENENEAIRQLNIGNDVELIETSEDLKERVNIRRRLINSLQNEAYDMASGMVE